MAGSARSHTRLRRTQEGTTLLDRRARGAFGSEWKVARILGKLDRPDAQDDVVRRLDEVDGRVLGVRPNEWVRRAAERFARYVSRLPDPELVTVGPTCELFKVRTLILDGVAHQDVALRGRGNWDPECLGCGRVAEPGYGWGYQLCPDCRSEIAVIDRSPGGEVVTLTRGPSDRR